MSQTTMLTHLPASASAARGTGSLIRLLLGVAVLSAAVGSVATTVLDRFVGATAAPQLAPVPTSTPVTTTVVPGERSVPEASAVFFGREASPEEPPASF
jgi:hypothetical protein